MKYYFHDSVGKIHMVGECPDAMIDAQEAPDGLFKKVGEAKIGVQYHDENLGPVAFPEQPDYAEWDWDTKQWTQNMATAKTAQLAKLSIDYDKICQGTDPATGKDIYVDCTAGGTTYRMNAGQAAATNMDAGVRIFELSRAGYMPVVRDFYNVNHANVPIADARAIALQQGGDALNYWQQKGQMVDAINAATTVEEVQAVDITFNVNVL